MLTNLRETVTGNVVEVPASAPAVSFVVSWLTSEGLHERRAKPAADSGMSERFEGQVKHAMFMRCGGACQYLSIRTLTTRTPLLALGFTLSLERVQHVCVSARIPCRPAPRPPPAPPVVPDRADREHVIMILDCSEEHGTRVPKYAGGERPDAARLPTSALHLRSSLKASDSVRLAPAAARAHVNAHEPHSTLPSHPRAAPRRCGCASRREGMRVRGRAEAPHPVAALCSTACTT